MFTFFLYTLRPTPRHRMPGRISKGKAVTWNLTEKTGFENSLFTSLEWRVLGETQFLVMGFRLPRCPLTAVRKPSRETRVSSTSGVGGGLHSDRSSQNRPGKDSQNPGAFQVTLERVTLKVTLKLESETPGAVRDAGAGRLPGCAPPLGPAALGFARRPRPGANRSSHEFIQAVHSVV